MKETPSSKWAPRDLSRWSHLAGLAPEEYQAEEVNLRIIINHDGSHSLTASTVNSLLWMWTISKEERFREMGWKIFQSFMLHSRTKQGAFATLQVGKIC